MAHTLIHIISWRGVLLLTTSQDTAVSKTGTLLAPERHISFFFYASFLIILSIPIPMQHSNAVSSAFSQHKQGANTSRNSFPPIVQVTSYLLFGTLVRLWACSYWTETLLLTVKYSTYGMEFLLLFISGSSWSVSLQSWGIDCTTIFIDRAVRTVLWLLYKVKELLLEMLSVHSLLTALS